MPTELVDLVNDLTFDAEILPLAVPATVTRPSQAAITTVAVWLLRSQPEVPAGAAFQRSAVRRVIALRRSDVPTVPLKTIIVAPERPGLADATWRVDSIEQIEADRYECVVIAEP